MISYDDALASLMAMFPDVDTDTISTVLRDHNGHMERTIDALLVLFASCFSSFPSICFSQHITEELHRRGQKPVNGIEPGPAQVAQDEALAMEVQRRLAVQAAMEDQARARQQQQARARAAAAAAPRQPPSCLFLNSHNHHFNTTSPNSQTIHGGNKHKHSDSDDGPDFGHV